MHLITIFRSETTRRKRLGLAAACLATMATANLPATSQVSAGAPSCGCADECDGGCGREHGPIYKTLDTVAGGIEKLLFFSLKHRVGGGCDEMACDDGCDAMTMADMMMYEETHVPMGMAPPVLMQPSVAHPSPTSPGHVHAEPSLPPQSPPRQIMRSVPAPSTYSPAPARMSQPTLTPMMPPASRTPVPMPLPEGDEAMGSGLPLDRGNDDSLFDNLQDPFRDDSAQLNAPRSNDSRSTITRPASYRTSSRRVINSR